MGYAADRDFESAWRNGRSFNHSITLSGIAAISCAKAELHAMIVQLQRSEKIWPSRSRVASIAGGNRILLTLMAASSPLKQANGTQIQSVTLGGRIVFIGKLIPFFQTVVREPTRAESQQDAAMPKIRPTTAKKLKRAAIARIHGRPAKPRPKLSGSRGRPPLTADGGISACASTSPS
jgi:hypothetical protein